MFYYETGVGIMRQLYFNKAFDVGKGCNIILYLFHITNNIKHEVYKGEFNGKLNLYKVGSNRLKKLSNCVY